MSDRIKDIENQMYSAVEIEKGKAALRAATNSNLDGLSIIFGAGALIIEIFLSAPLTKNQRKEFFDTFAEWLKDNFEVSNNV